MSTPYWRLSLFYFFYFTTLGSFLPYWNLYLKHTGLNAAQIGELSAIIMATKIISPYLWGVIADRTGKRLKIIRLTSFFTAVLFIGFFLHKGFYWFAFVSVSYSFFWNASLPQFEAATLFHLQKQPHRYSQIRLWGSIGFIIAVIGIGRVLDHYGIQTLPTIVALLFFSIWIAALAVPEIKPITQQKPGLGIGKIVKKPETIAFFSVYLLLQAAHGPYYVFYSIHLKQLNYSSALIGELWALGVIAEIILFMYMKKILSVFSLRNILSLSVFLSVCRWILIGFASSLYYIAGAQLLHAATFACPHIVAIHLVHHYFGSQHQGKGQALYVSLSFGLGGMIGSLFSGYYWEKLDGRTIYTIAALCCLVALIIIYGWIGKKKPTS